MLPDTRFLSRTLAEPLGIDLRIRVASGEGSTASLTAADRARYERVAGTPRARSWLLGRTALAGLRSELEEFQAQVRELDTIKRERDNNAQRARQLEELQGRIEEEHAAEIERLSRLIAEFSGLQPITDLEEAEEEAEDKNLSTWHTKE